MIIIIIIIIRTIKDMNYQTSTQRQSWTMNEREVMNRRLKQREIVIKQIIDSRRTEEAEEEKERERTSENGNENDDERERGNEMKMKEKYMLPTMKEEEVYRKRLEAKIEPLCNAFNLPIKVTTAAQLLFKRFCLQNSILTTNLKIVMVASVYVACKVEESYVSAEQLCKVVKDIDHNKVLNAELAVLQGVNFQLISFSAFRPLRGFRADAIHTIKQMSFVGGAVDDLSETIRECYNKAAIDLKKQLLTDLVFIYPPGQLALSAFLKAAREEKCKELEDYILTKCLRNEQDLIKNLEEIERVTEIEGLEPKEADAKKADQAIKAFQKKHANSFRKAAASKEEDDDEETREKKKQKVISDKEKEDAAFE